MKMPWPGVRCRLHGPVEAWECNMIHDTKISPHSISHSPTRADVPGEQAASLSSPAVGIEQQRHALRRQVDALRHSGALPSASAADQPASAVQWNNWSNG